MDVAGIVLLGGVLIFAAHFFAWLFSFTKVPDVLLLIGVGLMLGPVSGLITPEFFGDTGALFSVIVLAILLFESGTELRLDVIKESWRGTLVVTTLNFIATVAAVGSIVLLITDLSPLLSYMLAAIVGGTSSAIVIPLVDQLNMGRSARAMALLESALSDVLSIVVTIALLTAYSSGIFSAGTVGADIIASFVGAAIVGVLAALLWSVMLNRVRYMQNSIFSTPAFVFILFGLTELMSWSGPIAALAFGITMGNIAFIKLYLQRKHVFLHAIFHPVTLNEGERSFFSEIVFLLQTFFFVYVGISITLANQTILMIGLGLVVVTFLLRIPIIRLALPRETPSADRSLMAVLVPKGLAAAVLAALVAQQGIPEGVFIQETVYSVILLSVVVTSLLVFLVYKTPVGRMYAAMTTPKGVVITRSPDLGKE